MLKILGQRSSYPVVDLSPVYEKTTSTCQPRRSQRHSGATSVNAAPEPALDDSTILHRLPRVEDSVAPEPSDETEQLLSSGDSTSVGAPRRSQRSHKRSRFMDDEYLSSPGVGRTPVNDDVKVLVQRRNLGNEPAMKKRSLKSLSSVETGARDSPTTTAIHSSTSPAQKGTSRAVTRRSLGPVVRYPVGTRLNVKYGAGNPQIYEAKVIDVDVSPQVPRYRVHYRGWNKSHDSWITKIDVVSVIEKPSFPAATASGETVKAPSDTAHKIPTKVVLTDCKLGGHERGSGKESKTTDVETPRKKRKQDSEEELDSEDGGQWSGSARNRRTRLGRRRQHHGNAEGSGSSSEGSLAAEEDTRESEDEVREEMDGSGLELVAEEGVAGDAVVPEKDGDKGNGRVENGVIGASGTEEEKDGVEGTRGTEEDDGEEVEENRANGDEDDGERDERGSEDSRRREEEDGEDEEKDDEEEEDGAEDRSFDSDDRSATRIVSAESCLLSPLIETIETLQDETSSILSLNLDQSSGDQKPTPIDDSIVMSESSCESDSMEPAFGCDAKATADDFLDKEIPNYDVSVSNSNSVDACIELLPAETDSVGSGGTNSVRSGGTSSIASERHCLPDSSGNTTTNSNSQLYEAESTRHFAKLRSSPAYRTNFIDLESELKGLDEAEKEDYILSKMRKIQIEYKHMSSIYNKLTRRCNRASNRKKSHSRRHSSVTIATADKEASPVC